MSSNKGGPIDVHKPVEATAIKPNEAANNTEARGVIFSALRAPRSSQLRYFLGAHRHLSRHNGGRVFVIGIAANEPRERFSGLRRLNKEHTTSLKAQNAAQNGPEKTPRSPVFSF
jgi:hypothetical protein